MTHKQATKADCAGEVKVKAGQYVCACGAVLTYAPGGKTCTDWSAALQEMVGVGLGPEIKRDGIGAFGE